MNMPELKIKTEGLFNIDKSVIDANKVAIKQAAEFEKNLQKLEKSLMLKVELKILMVVLTELVLVIKLNWHSFLQVRGLDL